MDNTRLFLFAALAFVGMLMWQQWQLDYGPQPVTSSEVSNASDLIQAGEDSSNIVDLPDQAEGLVLDSTGTQETTASLASERLIKVETDVVSAVIDSKGGVIRSLKLKKYPISLDTPEQGLELIHSDPGSLHVLQSGLRNRSNTAPTHHSIYQTAKSEYNLQDGEDGLIVPFLWEQDGIKVIKTYEFRRGDYLIDVKHRVENNTDQDWQGSQYRQIQRTRPLTKSRILITYTGAVYYNEEVKYEKVDFDDMEDSQLKVKSHGGWIAMLQHYFLSAWIPPQDDTNLAYSIANTGQQPATYTIGLRSENALVSPGKSTEFTSQLFVGPKLVKRLEEITPGLDLTVDYGVLTFLSKPLYWLLSFYQS
jgi:YidC/Oxa1 family membrane protein insertase